MTWDDPVQAEKAKRLFESNRVFVPKTVLLETEWVLRALYGFERNRVADALRGFVALDNLECEDRANVEHALDWVARGLDFADALHLASSLPAKRFATFDAKLLKTARGIADIETAEP